MDPSQRSLLEVALASLVIGLLTYIVPVAWSTACEPQVTLHSCESPVRCDADGIFRTQLISPRFVFEFIPVAGDRRTPLDPQQAVFAVHRQGMRGPILDADLHSILAACPECCQVCRLTATGRQIVACRRCGCSLRVRQLAEPDKTP